MCLQTQPCLVCGKECPPILKVSRWGPLRKYCSDKCTKKAYSLKYPERDIESKRKYAEANKEKHCAATEKYRKENPGYYREYSSLRTRKLQQAKPKWLTEYHELFIAEMYDIAVRRKLHVDHIIPLTNKLVCGLHVPWNLQLLPPTDNFKKNNKFNSDEDVVCVFKD